MKALKEQPESVFLARVRGLFASESGGGGSTGEDNSSFDFDLRSVIFDGGDSLSRLKDSFRVINWISDLDLEIGFDSGAGS